MIPPFEESGLLLPGVHAATWQEVAARFGGNERRDALLEGLRRALQALKDAGCRVAYVDGSFVTSKETPGDFDACWERYGVDYRHLALRFRSRPSSTETHVRRRALSRGLPYGTKP
jgi:hypothetical protein